LQAALRLVQPTQINQIKGTLPMTNPFKAAVELLPEFDRLCKNATGDPWEIRERFNRNDPFEIIGGIDGDANDDGTLRMICTEVAELADNEDEQGNAAFILFCRNNARKIITALSACRGLADGSEVIVKVDWEDDPASDERWNAGVDFAQMQLCAVLKVDPKTVTWDAATETLDGDVQAVIGNILEKSDYRKRVLEEAARALQNIDQFDGCKLGFMDFETGVRECALDVSGGNCLCAERDEAITKAVEKLHTPAKTEKGD
jgi:hypothetical protein